MRCFSSFVSSLPSANTAATAPDNLRHPNALLSQVLHDLRLIYANHLNIVYPLPPQITRAVHLPFPLRASELVCVFWRSIVHFSPSAGRHPSPARAAYLFAHSLLRQRCRLRNTLWFLLVFVGKQWTNIRRSFHFAPRCLAQVRPILA